MMPIIPKIRAPLLGRDLRVEIIDSMRPIGPSPIKANIKPMTPLSWPGSFADFIVVFTTFTR